MKLTKLLGLLLCSACLIGTAPNSQAQAPTSLQYPTPNTIQVGAGSVFLSPTLAGNATSYSISPALPSGMTFSTSTGLIGGAPTVGSAAKNYTVTATNSYGSTSSIINIKVLNSYYDASYDTVKFVHGTGTYTNLKGNGENLGDSVLYKNVITVGGQSIDCIVTTAALDNVSSFTAYDQEATSGNGYNSNLPRFFSPQINFGTNGGSATFKFQYIEGGSYVNSSNPGVPVILQNVKVNTYDIDGNGNTNSNQFNEFDAFDTSEVGNPTNLVISFNSTTSLTKFRSNTSSNTSTIISGTTRARVTYNNVSEFAFNVGADGNGAAYYFIDFSPGSVAFTPVTKGSAPIIDLNTDIPGVNNANIGCSDSLSFSGGTTQTNVESNGTAFTELRVSFPTASIIDGADEKVVFKGATAGAVVALNTNPSITNLTLGGVAYSVSGSVTSGIRTLVITRNSGSFVLANVEGLLDAMRYLNTSINRTNGKRSFTLTARNASYESTAAIFNATINCGTISGNIWHDANGLSDSIVNANGPAGQFAANGAYAVLVDPTTNTVIKTVPIAAGGAYTFGSIDAGNYNIFVSNTATPPTTLTSPSYPAGGYISTGENLGTAKGNDLLVDGKLNVTLGSIPVTNANFGVQIPPVTTSSTYSNIPNPGGFNGYTPVAGAFGSTDADGTVDSIKITAFPTGANYIKIGTTFYTNPVGGQCPPQSTCTAWPGSVTLPYANVSTISVDPSGTGNTQVVIPFSTKDNGYGVSNNSTVTLNFTVPATPISITGNVWNDADGNGNKNGAEANTNAAGTGETLFAVLVQSTNTYSGDSTIYTTVPVAANGSYTFPSVPAGNSYEVRIVSSVTTPVDGANLNTITPKLAPGYTGVSTNNNGGITTYATPGTNNLRNVLGIVNSNKTNVDFGIERSPVADPKSFTAPNSAFTQNTSIMIGGKPTYSISATSASLTGSAIKSLSGNDAEDCSTASSCAVGKKFQVKTIKANTLVYYNFGSGLTLVTANTVINNFDPANMTIYGQQGQGSSAATALGFDYSLIDAAGIASTPAPYRIQSANALPILFSDFAVSRNACVASLSWNASAKNVTNNFEVQRSTDGRNFDPIGTVAAHQEVINIYYQYNVEGLKSSNYFRIKCVDATGVANFSKVLFVAGGQCETNNITIAPNPVINTLSIKGLPSDNATILLYNSFGVLVDQLNTTESRASLRLNEVANGVYQLRILDQNGQLLYSGSILKQ